jgi:hypothetical protein
MNEKHARITGSSSSTIDGSSKPAPAENEGDADMEEESPDANTTPVEHLATILQTYEKCHGPGHPKVIAAKAELEEAKSKAMQAKPILTRVQRQSRTVEYHKKNIVKLRLKVTARVDEQAEAQSNLTEARDELAKEEATLEKHTKIMDDVLREGITQGTKADKASVQLEGVMASLMQGAASAGHFENESNVARAVAELGQQLQNAERKHEADELAAKTRKEESDSAAATAAATATAAAAAAAALSGPGTGPRALPPLALENKRNIEDEEMAQLVAKLAVAEAGAAKDEVVLQLTAFHAKRQRSST